jgi:ankyrin repeat protein
MPETTSSSAAFIDAIKAGEFERVKAMVSADPTLIDARSRTGESAILTAVYHRQKEIVNLLVARGAPLTLFEACAAGEIERVERLLAEDATASSATAATAGRRCTSRRSSVTRRSSSLLSRRTPTSRRGRATRTATRRCTRRWPAISSWWSVC